MHGSSNSTSSTHTHATIIGTGTIGGQVFLDHNNDGVLNSNTGSNGNSVFTNTFDIISGVSLALYPCDSTNTLQAGGVTLAGTYTFSNLVAGQYYIGASAPAGYAFSSYWSRYGDTDVAPRLFSSNTNNNNAIMNTRGTGGVVNGVIELGTSNGPIRNTIDPVTGTTTCFSLGEGESQMHWGVGLYEISDSYVSTLDPSNAPTAKSSVSPSSMPSNVNTDATTINTDSENKWFVHGNICERDCPPNNSTTKGHGCTSITTVGTMYANLYSDAATCCEEGLGWSNQYYCKSRSDPEVHGVDGGPYTGMWFVDYDAEVCVQDCDASSPSATTCADLGEGSSAILYNTTLACCRDKLNWIDEAVCLNTVTAQPSYQPSLRPTISDIPTRLPTNVTLSEASQGPSASPIFVQMRPEPTNNPTLNKPAEDDDVSKLPSSMPTTTAANGQWAQVVDNSLIGTNIDSSKSLSAGSDNSETGSIIGIVCGVVVFSIIAAAIIAVYRRRKRKPDDHLAVVEVSDEEVPTTVIVDSDRDGPVTEGSEEHSLMSPAIEAAMEVIRYSSSMGDNMNIVREGDEESPPLARKSTYPPDPVPVLCYESKLSGPDKLSDDNRSGQGTHQMSFPSDTAAYQSGQESLASIGSNDSGQGTYYSAGGGTVTELPPVSRAFNRSLSPSSSQSASDAEKKTLAELEKEFTSLSLAIKAFQPNTATWLMIHGHLERAREELDAVQQDIEMSLQTEAKDEVSEEELVTSPPIPVPAINTIESKDDGNAVKSTQSPQTRSPERSRSRSSLPGSRSQSPEPEVWIHCPERDESSLDNSLITFDEWSIMDGTSKPDPVGCTKYLTSTTPQLMAITENGEADVPSEKENANEEMMMIENGEGAQQSENDYVPGEGKKGNTSNYNAGISEETDEKNVKAKRKSKQFMRLFKT